MSRKGTHNFTKTDGYMKEDHDEYDVDKPEHTPRE